jgi:hypothetical protein
MPFNQHTMSKSNKMHNRCKQGNMSRKCLLMGLLLGNIFKNIYILKSSKKIQINFLKKCYYVKVYVKDFKMYVIFKSFEVYL